MSVATEIARITTDRNTIRAKLVELGMAQNTDGLDKLATAVEGIANQGAVSATVQEGTPTPFPRATTTAAAPSPAWPAAATTACSPSPSPPLSSSRISRRIPAITACPT